MNQKHIDFRNGGKTLAGRKSDQLVLLALQHNKLPPQAVKWLVSACGSFSKLLETGRPPSGLSLGWVSNNTGGKSIGNNIRNSTDLRFNLTV